LQTNDLTSRLTRIERDERARSIAPERGCVRKRTAGGDRIVELNQIIQRDEAR
jgi:hypothetical protein